MPPQANSSGQRRLATRLQAIAELDSEDMAALAALPMTVRQAPAGAEIVREGERTHESVVLVDGFLQRHKDLPSGARQVLAFHVPGDVPDLQSLHLPVLDHTLAAVADSTIAAVPHAALYALARTRPNLGVALWRESLIDAAKFREWIANLGGRRASARLAHLLCEIYVRSRAVGVAEGAECFMPLTQPRLAEALGLSAVHGNRSMTALRTAGFLELKGRQMRILDWEGLRAHAEFDPAYLHLRQA